MLENKKDVSLQRFLFAVDAENASIEKRCSGEKSL